MQQAATPSSCSASCHGRGGRRSHGRALLRYTPAGATPNGDIGDHERFATFRNDKAPLWTTRYTDLAGTEMLAAFAKVGIGDLFVTTDLASHQVLFSVERLKETVV